jgi:CheY-like chemotaxis protein
MHLPSRAPRVLVAEDDDAMRALLEEALERRGYLVETAATGDALLRRVAHSVHRLTSAPLPDLLITDVRMPGRSGLDVVAALRAADAWLPVIVITAFGDAPTHARARRLGAALVLEKPFELEELCRIARQLLLPRPN